MYEECKFKTRVGLTRSQKFGILLSAHEKITPARKSICLIRHVRIFSFYAEKSLNKFVL
jgi:hypothetical protein